MRQRTNVWLGVIAALALTFPAFAADPEKAPAATPSAEQRQKMAEVHQRMADCLKSERPMSECRSEMMKGCEGMGRDACPMMGMGRGMGYGMGGGMMKGQPAPEAPEK
jgi:hypothetical protein